MSNSSRRRIDLHTHSTASDGELPSADLVRLAIERGLNVIALTDHDSIAGIDAAIESARGTALEVIPGVELSADVEQGEVHVLGYFVDWHAPHFLSMLEKFREGRYGRAEKMAHKLTALGAPISFERVKEIAGDAAIGRPHVAQALLEAGHIANVSEAFDKYIGRNGPAYVERFRLTPEDAVSLILQAGGVPEFDRAVLPAAPGFYHRPREIAQLVDFVVQRIVDHLGLDIALVPRWGEGERGAGSGGRGAGSKPARRRRP